MRRNWIKLYVDQCLKGTMMGELTAEQRWVWVGILLLAGDSNISGKVYLRKDAEQNLIGYSDNTIAELLAVSLESYQAAKDKMIRFKKITVDKNNTLDICNWAKYQSEYERQRPYRYRKTSNFESNKSAHVDSEEDSDKDIDKDIKDIYVKKWNKFAKENNLSEIQAIKNNSTREIHLRMRLKEGIDFDLLLEKIKKQTFLLGENKEGWTVTFDWVINKANSQKIMEEQYLKREMKKTSNKQISEQTKKWLEKSDD